MEFEGGISRQGRCPLETKQVVLSRRSLTFSKEVSASYNLGRRPGEV